MEKPRLLLLVWGGAIILVGAVYWLIYGSSDDRVIKDADNPNYSWEVEVVGKNLDIPWDLAILPGKSLLITERTGAVKQWQDGQLTTVANIEVAIVSESGLTGIALHPDFVNNQLVYLYYTYRTGGELKNRVERYRLSEQKLTSDKIILDGLYGGQIHNGGRLRFGPDKMLYVLTGDAARPDVAQDHQRLEGKVLRMTDSGEVPEDNPTKQSLVYSLGHRNPQGLSWHALTEQLFSTEHGQSAHDELNLIIPNGNYGWPKASLGSDDHAGYIAPILGSGSDTWAPSGFDFAGLEVWGLRNTALMAGLRGQKLWEIKIEDGKVTSQQVIIDGTYGRLRAVVSRGDGSFYVTTSNRDGRATPTEDDDRLLLVTPTETN